jgi:hypothetical protein
VVELARPMRAQPAFHESDEAVPLRPVGSCSSLGAPRLGYKLLKAQQQSHPPAGCFRLAKLVGAQTMR